jgi:hypothetical protein
LQPEGSQDVIKTPAALKLVDNVALRDFVLHEKHAACVDARGDVYQWGEELFDDGVRKPILTLRGKVSRRECAQFRSLILDIEYKKTCYFHQQSGCFIAFWPDICSERYKRTARYSRGLEHLGFWRSGCFD